jgi:hypothetical protein
MGDRHQTRKTPYHFRRHALDRLGQRTQVEREALLDLMVTGLDVSPATSFGHERGRIFWSPADDRAFLALYNYRTGEVITIMPAYQWVDGVFKGTGFIEHGIHAHPDRGNRVEPKDVSRLLRMLGLPPRPEFEPPVSAQDLARQGERTLQASARLSFWGVAARMIGLGRVRVRDAAVELEADHWLDKFQHVLSKRLDALPSELVVSAVIEFTDPKHKTLEHEIPVPDQRLRAACAQISVPSQR